MEYLRVKNWQEFQHYKDRTPPWIKLYNHLLDDFEFSCLPDASKAHLLSIWLLASRTENRIPNNAKWISNKINATDDVDINLLLSTGFIEKIPNKNKELQTSERDASKALQKSEQDACTEREERERRERVDNKDSFPPIGDDSCKDKNNEAKEVLEYLNEISNSKYKASTKSHIENINARLRDGHSVEDLKLVTKHKVNEWINDPKMVNYIRPATLYQAGKFNGYLLAARASEPKEPIRTLSQDEQLEQQRKAFEEGLKYL